MEGVLLEKELESLIMDWAKKVFQARDILDCKNARVLNVGAPQSLIWERLKAQIVTEGIERGELLEVEVVDVRLNITVKKK